MNQLKSQVKSEGRDAKNLLAWRVPNKVREDARLPSPSGIYSVFSGGIGKSRHSAHFIYVLLWQIAPSSHLIFESFCLCTVSVFPHHTPISFPISVYLHLQWSSSFELEEEVEVCSLSRVFVLFFSSLCSMVELSLVFNRPGPHGVCPSFVFATGVALPQAPLAY